MPRRSILSATEQTSLLALPDNQDDLIQHYTLNEADMALVRQRRGEANRLGFAVQLCLLRFPGYALGNDLAVPDPIIQWVARQIRVDAGAWANYGERDTTPPRTSAGIARLPGLDAVRMIRFSFFGAGHG